LIFFFLSILIGCNQTQVGEIIIRNDIQDKEYNSFVVDEVYKNGSRQSYKKTFYPGDEEAVPFSEITGIRFVRKYADRSDIYVVSCPAKKKSKVLLKLIDIYSNRLSGGCLLRKKGTEIDGIVRWK